MRFESVLSQADLIEALTPNRRSDGSSKPAGRNFIRGLAGWILFLLIATLMFLLMNQPRASAPVADEELTHNCWMTVLPPFIPALLFVAFLCYALAEQSPSIPFYAPKLAVASHRAAGRTLAIAMVLAAVAVAVAWILRPGGLYWAPSRSRLIIAGVFPWLLFMAISLGGLGLLMRRRQACLLPENGSAFIPHLTDINADGIDVS